MVFKKLKMGIWFFCGFMIIMLFLSLILKHIAENYITVITAACVSFAVIPLYTYFRRRKNFSVIREYFSTRFSEEDSNFDRFKKSILFLHFKAEAIAAFIYCSVGAFAFSYYFSQRDGAKHVALISLLCALGAYGLIMLADLIIWGRTVVYYESKRRKK